MGAPSATWGYAMPTLLPRVGFGKCQVVSREAGIDWFQVRVMHSALKEPTRVLRDEHAVSGWHIGILGGSSSERPMVAIAVAGNPLPGS